MRLVRKSLHAIILNRLLKFIDLNVKGVFIAKGSVLGAKQITIGYGSRINEKIIIKGGDEVSIGKYCAIGGGVRIITSNHALNTTSIQLALQKKIVGSVHLMAEKSGVEIGHDVWIGDGAIILPGVNIGNGAVIGAGSIVTRNVGAYEIAAGNPARIIKRRLSEDISHALESLQWWDLSEDQLKEEAPLFGKLLLESEKEEVLRMIQETKKRVVN